MEIKQIPGHEDYGVTREGEVWSKRQSGFWKRLALHVNGKWRYKKVKLTNGKTFKVHKLVALTFMGNPDGLTVNHIDGDKSNNHVDNLEYVTQSENMLHAHRTGLIVNKKGRDNPNWKPGNHQYLPVMAQKLLHPKRRITKECLSGEANPASKLTEAQVIEILEDRKSTHAAIARKYSVSAGLISMIRRGKKWGHLKVVVGEYQSDWTDNGVRRGEGHHACKLTAEQVEEIRLRGRHDYNATATEYGVSERTVRQVINHESWNHV